MSLKIGAVLYSPNVSVIWEIIADFFKKEGFPITPVYYKDYVSQVDALLKGEIDVAWNSPLAWLDTNIRTSGKLLNGSMRDTDRNRKTYLVVRKDSNFDNLDCLREKTIGFGAFDSPQARLIPIYYLHAQGLEYGQDYVEKRFDLGVGLDGDHIGGELDAARAMMNKEVAGSFMLDLNYEAWIKDGTLDHTQVEILAKTPNFDHCIFCGRPELDKEKFDKFAEVLHKMDYNNPDHKEMMDMEGLKEWVVGRTTGFEQLTKANEYINFLERRSEY